MTRFPLLLALSGIAQAGGWTQPAGDYHAKVGWRGLRYGMSLGAARLAVEALGVEARR